MQKRLRDMGAEPETATPDAYARYVRDEAQKWGAVVRQAGLAP
jgi:tripartite-type tricarboxylate transporter receptor subunit TctC